MGNSLTNNLPADLDQFLMDMAQTVGPFDYSDVMKFANKISDVKTDKNIAIIRRLYAAAKNATEYDDDDEFFAVGEDLNDIVTGVKDFNQPGAIFADTRTFKYEDSQTSEYNDLGIDIRTGEKFPEPLNESENALTDTQKDLIKEIALADFECGQFTTADFFIDDEEGDFTGVEQAAADYYQELVDMGPAGFYEEFAGELDFDPDFVAEYGDSEEDDLDESSKFKSKRINEDEDCGFVRDFVDELVASGLTDEIYEQVTENKNYSSYQLELVDDAIRHFIDDWRNDSGDIEAETAEEAKQIILNSIDDYLEPNLPDDGDDERAGDVVLKTSIENWDKKEQETYRAALKELEKDHELTKGEKQFIKETCYYIYSNLGRQLTDEELKVYCDFAEAYDMSVLKDEGWTTKEWAENFVKEDVDSEDKESYEFFTSHGYPDPFYAGKEAYKGKDSIYRNPYRKGSWAHGAYVAGYTSAALDNGDKRFFERSIKKNNLKEDLDLNSLVGKKVKCIKGASHPNMGKLFDKGRTYTVSKSEDGRICVGKVYVGKEFFDSHFEVEN